MLQIAILQYFFCFCFDCSSYQLGDSAEVAFVKVAVVAVVVVVKEVSDDQTLTNGSHSSFHGPEED